jgi:hypothetical protein
MNSLIVAFLALTLAAQATMAQIPAGTCTNGEFQCTDSEQVLQCNIDHWVMIADCASQGLVCMRNDYECVPPLPCTLTTMTVCPLPTLSAAAPVVPAVSTVYPTSTACPAPTIVTKTVSSVCPAPTIVTKTVYITKSR